ncbi:hypothetical protein REPUB_Repub01dG0144900 [Reevesia pubescens]
MAKMALVLLFTLALVLSIQSVVGDNALSPEQATQSPSSSAGNPGEESGSSLIDWAEDKLRSYGLMSPKDSGSSASTPAPGPAAYGRSFGPGPTATPME